MQYRIGQGTDVHKLESETPLIIGGVSIPCSKGSKGHSDGDVLYHALVDSLLGSLAQGDIGQLAVPVRNFHRSHDGPVSDQLNHQSVGIGTGIQVNFSVIAKFAVRRFFPVHRTAILCW